MKSKRAKIAMIEQGIKLKQLKEKTGYSVSHLSNVISGRLRSPKARRAIAEALGIKEGHAFSDRR